MQKSSVLGHVSGIMFAVIFGFSFFFTKRILSSLNPIGLISYRFLLAFLVFEILRLTKVIKINITKKNIIPILLVSFFQPIMYFIFETLGLQLVSSSEAGMMIALIPIFVTILSAFLLKEKPSIAQVFFIVFSVSGIILIQVFKGFDNNNINLDGIILLFLAVISAALFNIASKKASYTAKPYEITYFMMLSGALVFNSIYVVQLINNHNVKSFFKVLNYPHIISLILYLGIVASIGGFFLVNYTLSKLPAHVSSIYSNLSTIVAVIAGYFLLNEQIYWYHIVGGIMIVLGVYLTVISNYRNQIKRND